MSSSNNTLVIKVSPNQYRLFVFDKNTVKPATLAAGSTVRVISTQTDDPEVRLAALVEAIPAPTPPPAPPSGDAAVPAEPDVVPQSIRETEQALNREVRKFHLGIQGGLALDPELMDIGINARFGPFFSKSLEFRPSVDFGFGEVTKLFALNGDFIYNMGGQRGARRNVYFGGGPQFNFLQKSFTDHDVNFSDFHYSTALNIVLGVRMRTGLFTELKTSVYANPAPIIRVIVGYSF